MKNTGMEQERLTDTRKGLHTPSRQNHESINTQSENISVTSFIYIPLLTALIVYMLTTNERKIKDNYLTPNSVKII